MNFKEVVGWRRSIRYFQPWRPVEREKIQTILEAARLAPKILGVDFVRTLTAYRDDLSTEDLEAMKGPTTTAQLDMAPVYIFWFADMEALGRVADGRNLKALADALALPPSHGWSHQYIDQVVVPQVYRRVLDDTDRVALARGHPGAQEGPSYPRNLFTLARTAIGLAQAHALLCAFEEGLGALLTALSADRIAEVPSHWVASYAMLVGYHAESWEAGGQRPREPFEQDFFEGRYGVPFHRDKRVVEELKAEGMIQPGAPLPWRREEIRGLARMFGLPE
ncbi:MAG: nitroreductase family protein [Dehalococcoidia bacterium]